MGRVIRENLSRPRHYAHSPLRAQRAASHQTDLCRTINGGRPSLHESTLAVSISLLTPQMAGLLDRIRRANRPPFHAMTVAEARAAYELGAEVLEPPRAPLAGSVTGAVSVAP